ncbi:MAG: tRNA lysidine(34) synthetase TilS [Buchnera aphidicola (Meitanaphis microgallis)]
MIIKYIEKSPSSSFLLAYSGGLDSTFLLHQLLKIKKIKPELKFRAIHINHQINKNANIWSEHCKKVCKKYNISLVIKTALIDKKKMGIEAAARLIRYRILYNEALPKETILVAHNLNDQCETILLALKRGSGITGLSGMLCNSKLFNQNTLIRPLLNITRSEIQSWMEKNNINWIKDDSNYNITYERNFIRNKILPLFTARWPSFIKKCAHSAFILQQEKKILDPVLKKTLKKYLISNSILDIKNFKNIKPEIRNSLLRTWIKLNNRVIPSYKIIKNIYYEIILSKSDSKALIKINDYEIKRYRNNLYLTNILPCIKNLIIMWHRPSKSLQLPNNLGYIIQSEYGTQLPYPQDNELINIRFQASGKILIQGNTKRKPIKQIWKEHGIPPWNRNNIPLLFYNHKLISALGVFAIPENNCIKNKRKWKLSWIG